MLEFLGPDMDGLPILVEKVNNACYLLHMEGNQQSPFEFSTEQEYKEFALLLNRFRMEERIEKLL
jgi:hypothetical protein